MSTPRKSWSELRAAMIESDKRNEELEDFTTKQGDVSFCQDFIDWLEDLGYIDVPSLLQSSLVGAYIDKWREEVNKKGGTKS